jgi:hypothetical protein
MVYQLPFPENTARASLPKPRNPVLGLKSFRKFATLHPAALDALADLLEEIHSEAALKAEHCWRTRKAPMAAYWRAVSVYAGHISTCHSLPQARRPRAAGPRGRLSRQRGLRSSPALTL